MTDEVLGRSLVETAKLIANRELSPVELVTAAINRIEENNRRLHAFVTVTADTALAAAQQAEQEIRRGQYRGSVHGIPFAVKDLFPIGGVPMTAGSAVLQGFVPDSDAAVVEQLKSAGAVIMGTAALDEFAFATTGDGIVNPVDEARMPGGSSGGSAVAVAANMCFGALGTDTGGSVRIPAACCNIVGVKPTFGRIDTAGIVPLAWSIDHIGVFARNVNDAAAILSSLFSMPAADARRTNLRGLRVGVPGDQFLLVSQEEVRIAFGSAVDVLSSLGATVSEVELPDSEIALNLQYLTVLPEAASYHLSSYPERLGLYGEGVRAALEWGATVRAIEYIDTQRVRGSVSRQVERVLSAVDYVALPTLPVVTPFVGQEDVVLGNGKREDVVSAMLRFTCMFNHTGHPAISVPCAPTGNSGLGLQLVGRYFSESPLLDVAAVYERAVR